MTEKEKMLAGQVYSAVDPELLEELMVVHDKIHRYNMLMPSDTDARRAMLKDLLGRIGDDAIIINPPFYCDYGKQIRVAGGFSPISISPCWMRRPSPSETIASSAPA